MLIIISSRDEKRLAIHLASAVMTERYQYVRNSVLEEK